MKPHYAVELTDSVTEGIRPFSNGTEGEGWMSCNCYECKRALVGYDADKYDYESTRDGVRSATLSGLNCFGEYAMACSYITGLVPVEICEWMGGTEDEFPTQCKHFTRDDKDRPDIQTPKDPRQLEIPFLVVSIFGFDDPSILVLDNAIIEKDLL